MEVFKMKMISTTAEDLSTNALLRIYAFFKHQLRERKYRNPVADHAVQLILRYLGGQRMKNCNKGYDLRMPDGRRVEVKARCIIANGTRVLASDIRCLKAQQFDLLAMVVFHADLTVARAFLVPHAVVVESATYSPHSNAWRFYLHENLLNLPGVREITEELKAVEAEGASKAMQYSLVVTA
jgi:hypothetical protein